jgi:hypothetical protein
MQNVKYNFTIIIVFPTLHLFLLLDQYLIPMFIFVINILG